MENEEKETALSTKSKSEPLKPKYAAIRKEGWDLMVEASTSYDKALITLTTAFLGFIFAVVKLSPSSLHCVSFLIFILTCLMISIFCSLLSFWFDQMYGDSIMVYAHRFYNEDIDEYETKKHWSYYASMSTKIIAGALFFLALILFSVFIFSNYEKNKTNSIEITVLYQNQNAATEKNNSYELFSESR